jgi:hypothetical protein
MIPFPRNTVASIAGAEPMSWIEVGGGYTPASRWRVEFVDGRSAFVKSAEGAEAWPIRREIATMSALEGTFVPAVLGDCDEEQSATLMLEDLSHWRWPPPYPDVLPDLHEMLQAVANHPPPDHLPKLEKPDRQLWPEIGANPERFLELGLCASDWLDSAIGQLCEAEGAFDPTGNDLVHNDIWAGNIAISNRRCVLIDWAEAKLGSRFVDLGFLHLSLRSEKGPKPESRFHGEMGFVGWWSATLAGQLMGPADPRLHPSINDGLRQDLRAALRWAAELLELPTPDH